jgi:hypothetical protein
LADGRETEEEHACRKPDAWFEFLQEKVGRNLKQDVRNEEDDQGDVESVIPVQIELVLVG